MDLELYERHQDVQRMKSEGMIEICGVYKRPWKDIKLLDNETYSQ